MYKVLVVDDEKWVRKGIIQKLKSSGFKFDWVGEAEDGNDALDVVGIEHPHIIITDIRMEEMDGLELIMKISAVYTGIKFIIISGYAEFEYAEKAINMGVSGYILKPVNEEQLIKTVRKVIAELEREKEITGLIEREEIYGRDSRMNAIKQGLWRLLSLSECPQEENTSQEAMPFSGCSSFVLAILNIDSSSYNISDFKYQDAGLVKFAVNNILNEIGKDSNVLITDNPGDVNQILILFYGHREPEVRISADRLLMEIFVKITGYLHIEVTLAISGVCGMVSAELFRQAREALDLKLVCGGNRIFRFENIKTSGVFDIPWHKLKLLQTGMETKNFTTVEVILNDLLSPKNLKDCTGAYVRFLYSEIINMLIKACSISEINIGNKIDAGVLSGEMILQSRDSGEIVKYIYATILNALQPDGAGAIDRKGLTERVREYIERNYHDDISVKDLAKVFAVNADYLSTIYRQETGQTIIRHLTSIRVEKACELLRETAFNTIEIGKSVGYNDHQYFYRVFKKVMGKTPVEYRSGLKTKDSRNVQ